MHSYGSQAFLLQWEHFCALRGHPQHVVSDKESQLTKAANYITWLDKEDPAKWGWAEISDISARYGTKWNFVLAGTQWRNGLAESRVKLMKSTLQHTMSNYAQLCRLVCRAN